MVRALGALVLVLALISLAQTGPGRSTLESLGLRSSGSHFTELAFSDPTQLRNAIPRGRSKVPVDFAITNHEGSDRSYLWTLGVPGTKEGESGRVVVKSGERKIVFGRLPVRCDAKRLRIVATLQHPTRSIDYTAACERGVKSQRLGRP
jgi:hypothetical protein